jgi:Peptidase family M28
MNNKLFAMRRFFKWLFILIILCVCAYYGYSEYRSIRMPGRTYAGTMEPLDNFQSHVRDHLREHVNVIAGQIGERNLAHYDKLEAAAAYIRNDLQNQDYRVQEFDYTVQGKTCRNLYAILDGTDKSKGIVVLGAHYDSVTGSPGANDNGSGVAAVLELARIMKNESPTKSVMFAFFPNEEPPYFQTRDMGSLALARELQWQKLSISGMISVETIGYYSDEPGSQKYPGGIASFYPKIGNFIGFVSDLHSRRLLKEAIAEFRASTHFPSEGATLPSWVEGVGFSDQWSFWQIGVPAIMVTDTAPFRYPYYHSANDTPDKIDYDKMARVVVGLKHVAMKLAE